MAKSDRRTFLKRSAAVVPAIVLGPEAAASLHARPQSEVPPAASTTLDAALLGAVGAAVLPAAELGKSGVDQAVRGFQGWLDGYEPVAELNHGYFSARSATRRPIRVHDGKPSWRPWTPRPASGTRQDSLNSAPPTSGRCWLAT